MGAVPETQKSIFARTGPGLIEQVVNLGNEGFAVVCVDERKLTSDGEFAKQKTQLQVEAIKAKQYETREAFKKTLKQTGTVVTNQKALDRVIGEG